MIKGYYTDGDGKTYAYENGEWKEIEEGDKR